MGLDDDSLTTLLRDKSPEYINRLKANMQCIVPAKSEWFSSLLDYLIPEITGGQRPSSRPVLQIQPQQIPQRITEIPSPQNPEEPPQSPEHSEHPSTEQTPDGQNSQQNLPETGESNSGEESGKTNSQGDSNEAYFVVLRIVIFLAIIGIVVYFVRKRKARQNH